jgi:LysR family transcriptional regulator, hydrogen peroxide-inducible genes activator
MVAAGVGMTLLPALAVQPPVPVSDDIRLIRFTDPAPNRRIAMLWRRSSPYRDFLPALAAMFRDLPPGFVRTDAPDAVSDARIAP